MKLNPHLCFNGQCKEAFELYHELFGGQLKSMLTYGKSPMADQVSEEFHDRILHATLELDDFEVLGADVKPEDYKPPQGFFIAISIEDATQGEKIFSSLSDGGQVLLPFQKTFWSPGFGVCVDRFRIPWEINSST